MKAAAHGAGAERFAAAAGSSNCYGEQLLPGAVLFQAGKNKEKDCCSLGWEAIYKAAFISLSRLLELRFCEIFIGEMRRF